MLWQACYTTLYYMPPYYITCKPPIHCSSVPVLTTLQLLTWSKACWKLTWTCVWVCYRLTTIRGSTRLLTPSSPSCLALWCTQQPLPPLPAASLLLFTIVPPSAPSTLSPHTALMWYTCFEHNTTSCERIVGWVIFYISHHALHRMWHHTACQKASHLVAYMYLSLDAI